MTPDEKLAALGLADVELITPDEFNDLPEHRRLMLGPLPGGGYVRLRLPDPPPVAALRRIHAAASTERRDVDLRSGLEYVSEQAAAALAEFDGTTS